jgi:hypothetical protein
MTKNQWMTVAKAALINSGLSPSEADWVIDEASPGLRSSDAEDTAAPTQADWQHAFENGGVRLHPTLG